MKKSHIAIWSAVGLITLCILVALILGRSILGNGKDWNDSPRAATGSGEYVEIELDLDDFDTVVIEGFWDLSVEQGNEFAVEVSYPPSWPKGNFVRQSGDSLLLEYPNVKDPDEGATAWVTMPELTELRIEGFGDSDFSGFHVDSMDLILEGAGRIKGMDSSIENARIVIQGAGKIDLDDTSTVNAEVIMEGAGETSLLMAGGELTGNLSGIGRIQYSGEVSSESVSIDGIGRVKYRR